MAAEQSGNQQTQCLRNQRKQSKNSKKLDKTGLEKLNCKKNGGLELLCNTSSSVTSSGLNEVTHLTCEKQHINGKNNCPNTKEITQGIPKQLTCEKQHINEKSNCPVLTSNKLKQPVVCNAKCKDNNDIKRKERNIPVKKETTKVTADINKTNVTVTASAKDNPSNNTNEELSKAKKRRLRKRKLLLALAATNSLNQNNNTQQGEKVVSNNLAVNTCRPVTVSNKEVTKQAETLQQTPKVVPKEIRKRIDKTTLEARKKKIKAKSPVESQNNKKEDICCIPINNTCQKLQNEIQAPLSGFSFPETNRSCLEKSDSLRKKTDSVFYFGETKSELQELTNLNSRLPTVSENKKTDFENLFKIKDIQFSNLSLNTAFNKCDTEVTCMNENISDLSIGMLKDLNKSAATNISYFDDILVENNKHLLSSSHINVDKPSFSICNPTFDIASISTQTLPLFHNIEKVESNIIPVTETLQNCEVVKKLIPKAVCEELDVKDKTRQITEKALTDEAALLKTNQAMKVSESSTQSKKINKSREEVVAEREARKAAKLAAKNKNKAGNVKQDTLKTDIEHKKGSDVTSSIDNNELVVVQETKKDKLPTEIKAVGGTQEVKEIKDSGTKTNIVASIDGKSDRSSGDIDLPKENCEPNKSKAELRAERRAKQEAQRAAKAEKQQQSQLKEEEIKPSKEVKPEKPKVEVEKKVVAVDRVAKTTVQHRVKLFSHLYQENKSNKVIHQLLNNVDLHPAIVRLGAQYSSRVVAGSNARCVALLHALKQAINDYSTPAEKEFSRGLEEQLASATDYLQHCRPLSVSMTNALRHIKWHLTQLPNNVPDVDARKKLCDIVDTYVRDQIDVAGQAICNSVHQKIANGDVILTYGCSSLIYRILVESHNSKTRFRVIVVDAGPWREGREMLRRLVSKGLQCSYVLISAASFVMREVSKVLLGAHALLANGYVMSRAGSSQVALLAHSYNVPVLVCCETHKFSERVQTDAIVYNELGDADEFVSKGKGGVSQWRSYTNLTPLSLAYDVTPPDLVTAVVTELAILPCTSVPVILRIKPSESLI